MAALSSLNMLLNLFRFFFSGLLVLLLVAAAAAAAAAAFSAGLAAAVMYRARRSDGSNHTACLYYDSPLRYLPRLPTFL